MNATELREYARRLAGTVFQEVVSDADVDAFVQETYVEMLNAEEWPFRRSEVDLLTVQGQRVYTLPSPLRHIESVYFPTADAPRMLVERWLPARDNEDDYDDQDPPIEYALVDHQELVLFPTPDGAYTLKVRGLAELPALDPDATVGQDGYEPVFHADFHPALAYGGAARVLRREGDDSGRSALYEREVAFHVDRMRHFYLKDHNKGLMRMGGRSRTYPKGWPHVSRSR